jgi:phosphoglycolate phosphatase-like HAD superfamily hydrolase
MSPGLWRALKDVTRLGVVTGRPRAEAEWFLSRHDLEPDCLVAMEDAPAKPDPTPVRMALERLGVERGWMIGDTPDDIVAAAGADVVPLGVVPPGEDALTWGESLTGAGACEVLDSVTTIEGWLL